MAFSQLHAPRILSTRPIPKTHWRRRSAGRDLWLSHPMGFGARSMQLSFSPCLLVFSMHSSHWHVKRTVSDIGTYYGVMCIVCGEQNTSLLSDDWLWHNSVSLWSQKGSLQFRKGKSTRGLCVLWKIMNHVEGVFHDTLSEWNWPSTELLYFPRNTKSPELIVPFIPWL